MTSLMGRLLSATTRLTVRPTLQIGCHALDLPVPFGLVELIARAVPKSPAKRQTVHLPHCTAQLVHAAGVPNSAGAILYFHGGGFLACGPNTHAGLITRLSKYSNMPVLAVDYRMIPTHSVGDAIGDCLDAYYWLRRRYQVALAGDSAGGYLAQAVANYLQYEDEPPTAVVMLSPLLQLYPGPRKAHPNIDTDAMFAPEAFDALHALVRRANHGYIYEPLDDLGSGLPPTLIHASGSEALLHDAQLARDRLLELGVNVTLNIWPDQIHVFQIAPWVPEADLSLRQIASFIVRQNNFVDATSNGLTNRTSTVG